MRSVVRALAAIAALSVASLATHAQVATGSYSYGTFDNPGLDTINVGNLNVHLGIPVLNKAGRGIPFNYALTFDNSIWYSSNGTWTPVRGFGWTGQSETSVGYVSYDSGTTNGRIRGQDGQWYTCPTTTDSDFVYHDPSGVSHPFMGATINQNQWPPECGTPTDYPGFTATATDGSGYTITVSNYNVSLVTTPLGLQINPSTPNGAAYDVDRNGNIISTDGNGNFTDTTGNVILTVTGQAPNPETLKYKDTNGNQQTVTVTYKSYTVQTNFGCGTPADYPATQQYLVDKIEFPDSSFYQFEYEATPSYPANVTGRLSSVTLPQGGTISYSYSGANHGINCSDGTTQGLERQLTAASGSAASTWTYTRTQPNGAGTSHTEVVDGNSNYKEYDFVEPSNLAPPITGVYYEANRTFYNGATTNPVQLSQSTCYNGNNSNCTTTIPTLPFSQVDTYQTLNGIETDGTTVQYNAYGMITQTQIWDFGSSGRGSPLRVEDWVYNYTLAGLPTSDLVYDGSGILIGETTYQYDQTTPTASSGVPQHVSVTGPRGNLTTETVSANSSTTYTITNTYEDTGSLLTSKFSGGSFSGTTTLAYDSTFVYLESESLPTPSSGVALSYSATYDTSYTGLLEKLSDPNTDASKVVSYDDMLRPTETTNPDRGQTNLTYTPTSVSAAIKQSSSASTTSEAEFDAYGRQSRSLLSNGQSTNPYYQQDTCYELNGNVSFSSYRYQGAVPAPIARLTATAITTTYWAG